MATAYGDIDRATWRAVGPLTEARVNAFKVELARRAVSLQPLPSKDEPQKRATDKNR